MYEAVISPEWLSAQQEDNQLTQYQAGGQQWETHPRHGFPLVSTWQLYSTLSLQSRKCNCMMVCPMLQSKSVEVPSYLSHPDCQSWFLAVTLTMLKAQVSVLGLNSAILINSM